MSKGYMFTIFSKTPFAFKILRLKSNLKCYETDLLFGKLYKKKLSKYQIIFLYSNEIYSMFSNY